MRHSCYLRASLENLKSLILNIGTGQFTTFFWRETLWNTQATARPMRP
nr:MAG TPA: hypothetical protein [Caudoviricetes sp.]